MNFVLRTILAFALFQYGVFAQNCVGDMTVASSENHTISIFKWSEASLSYKIYQSNVFGEVKESLIAANGVFASLSSESQSPTISNDKDLLDRSDEVFNIRLNLVESETEAKVTHLSVTFVPPTNSSLCTTSACTMAFSSLQEETILLDIVLTKGTWGDYIAGKTIEFKLTPEGSNLLLRKYYSTGFNALSSLLSSERGGLTMTANNTDSGISSFMANKELITHYTPYTSVDIEVKLCLN